MHVHFEDRESWRSWLEPALPPDVGSTEAKTKERHFEQDHCLYSVFSQAVGKAKIPFPINNPAKLEVSFLSFFLRRLFCYVIRQRLSMAFNWQQFGQISLDFES